MYCRLLSSNTLDVTNLAISSHVVSFHDSIILVNTSVCEHVQREEIFISQAQIVYLLLPHNPIRANLTGFGNVSFN